MNLINHLCENDDPSLAYRARLLLRGHDPAEVEMRALRECIPDSANARRLLEHRQVDGRQGTHAYQKWQGPHWTLYSLAMLAYPVGDESLRPMYEQVMDWLFSPRFFKPPSTQIIAGQEDRPRRCASQEGNAIYYSLKLGLADGRVHELVDRLVAFQWPDGGWNCDKRPEARTSSFVETLIPLRALWHYNQAYPDSQAEIAVNRAAEFLLQRRLLYRLSDGSMARLSWGGAIDRIHFPIQFYDVLFALVVMAEIGRIGDPRCADALKMLAARRLPDGGFPLEEKNAHPAETFLSRGSFADWGPAGKLHSNPWVSIDALWVLKEAGKALN